MQQQTQFDTLEGIKNQLIKIRDSDALKNVKADSDVAKGLAGTFGAVGGVLGDLQAENGVLTSRSARKSVENGQQVVPTSSNPNDTLQAEFAKLTEAFNREKSTRTALEADLSIADKRIKDQEQTGAVANPPAVDTPSATDTGTGDNTPAVAGVTAPTNADGTTDPIILGEQQALIEFQNNINNRLEELNQNVALEDEDTKASVRNIEASARLATQRIERENARLTQAAQVAGIVSGRGQYSPFEHEGIISEVIQEGLDRVTEIENTKTETVLATKKAFREFRYKAFVEGSEMVAKLSEMKLDTITAMAKRLQEVEQNQREKVKFDQEQADRNAFILAPELVGMTPEEIAKTAYANGIEPGALMRTVSEYEQEQKERGQADEAFDLKQKIGQADLAGKQINNRLSNIALSKALSGDSGGNDVDEMDDKTRKFWERSLSDDPENPIVIPPGMSEEAVVAIRDANPGVKGTPMQEILQREYTRVGLQVDGSVGNELVNARGLGLYKSGRNPAVNTVIDNLAKELKLKNGEALLSDQGFLITLGETALAVQSANPEIKAGEMDIALLMTKAAENYRTTIETSQPKKDPTNSFIVSGTDTSASIIGDNSNGSPLRSASGNKLDFNDPFKLNEFGINKKSKFRLDPDGQAAVMELLGL